MFKILQSTPIPVLLLMATFLEVSGDAIVRLGMYNHAGTIRSVFLLVGAALLLSYGFLVNTAPVAFGRIVGLYIATLFVGWQVINFLIFRAQPAASVWVGGTLVITGGTIVTFWGRLSRSAIKSIARKTTPRHRSTMWSGRRRSSAILRLDG